HMRGGDQSIPRADQLLVGFNPARRLQRRRLGARKELVPMLHGLEFLEQQEAAVALAAVAAQKRDRHAQARDRRKIFVEGESFEAVRLDALGQFELNHAYHLAHPWLLPTLDHRSSNDTVVRSG